MSRERGEAPLAELTIGTALPERLQTLLNGSEGVDPKTGAIRLLRAPLTSLLTPLRIEPRDIGVQETTESFTEDMLRRIVMATGMRVVQIDLRKDPPAISGKMPVRMRSIYESPTIPVFVITEEGPGILVLNPGEILTQQDIPAGLITIMKQLWFSRTEAAKPVAKLDAKPQPTRTELIAAAVKSAVPEPVARAQPTRAELIAAAKKATPQPKVPEVEAPQPLTRAELITAAKKATPIAPKAPEPVAVEPVEALETVETPVAVEPVDAPEAAPIIPQLDAPEAAPIIPQLDAPPPSVEPKDSSQEYDENDFENIDDFESISKSE